MMSQSRIDAEMRYLPIREISVVTGKPLNPREGNKSWSAFYCVVMAWMTLLSEG